MRHNHRKFITLRLQVISAPPRTIETWARLHASPRRTRAWPSQSRWLHLKTQSLGHSVRSASPQPERHTPPKIFFFSTDFLQAILFPAKHAIPDGCTFHIAIRISSSPACVTRNRNPVRPAWAHRMDEMCARLHQDLMARMRLRWRAVSLQGNRMKAIC